MVKPPVLSPGLQEGQGGFKGSGKETEDITNKYLSESNTKNIANHQERWKMQGKVIEKNKDSTLNDIKFFLDIPNPDKTNIVNIAEEHYAFISAVFVADPNAKFYPTVDTEDLTRKIRPFKQAIDTIDNFPKSDSDHRSFFHHYMVKKNRKVRIEERLVTHLSLKEIKDSIFTTLKTRKLWITNDELQRVETTIVGYIFYSDGPMTHIPTLERELNLLIKDYNLSDEQKERIKEYNKTEDTNLPEVIIRLRDLHLGNHQRILTEVLFIRAPKFLGPIYKEILSAAQVMKKDEIQGDFVPAGAVSAIGEENFKKMMLANNDHNNNIQAILLLNVSDEFLKAKFPNGTNIIITVNDFLLETPGVRSIQPTNKSKEIGKYFAVVHKREIDAAKNELHARINHAENSTSYKHVFPRAPKIAAGFAPDSSAHKLCFEFKKTLSGKPTVEEMLQSETQNPIHNAWNRPLFDLCSTSDTHDSTQAPPSAQSTTNSKTARSGILKNVNFEENTKTPTTQSQISDWDDKSISSTVSQLTQSIAQLESVTQSMVKLAEAQAKQAESQQSLFESTQAKQTERIKSIEDHIIASDARFDKMLTILTQMVPNSNPAKQSAEITPAKRSAESSIETTADQKKINASMEEH